MACNSWLTLTMWRGNSVVNLVGVKPSVGSVPSWSEEVLVSSLCWLFIWNLLFPSSDECICSLHWYVIQWMWTKSFIFNFYKIHIYSTEEIFISKRFTLFQLWNCNRENLECLFVFYLSLAWLILAVRYIQKHEVLCMTGAEGSGVRWENVSMRGRL